MKNFAIIGFGGLGKMHFLNLMKLMDDDNRPSIRDLHNNVDVRTG